MSIDTRTEIEKKAQCQSIVQRDGHFLYESDDVKVEFSSQLTIQFNLPERIHDDDD